eukprot:8429283-Pyramimonas_sp.AAC.1
MAQERIGEENKKLIRSMQEIVHRPGQVVRMIHDSENTGHGPWMAAHCNDFYRPRGPEVLLPPPASSALALLSIPLPLLSPHAQG